MTLPPALARLLVRWTTPPARCNHILGDLEEEFRERGADLRARRWYWRQALGSVVPMIRHRLWRLHWNRTAEAAAKGDGVLEKISRDLRFALRAARKNLAFSVIVVLTLGLGIGANTVIYGVVDGVILNPFPFPDGDRLVAIGTQYPKLGASNLTFVEHMAPLEYVDLREQATTLEKFVAWDMGNRQVSLGEVTENLFTGFWWGDGFETLEMPPHLGRGMTWEESVGGDPVAVLSYRIWESRFGADPDLVGGTVMMNGNPYTVIGIMPPRGELNGMDLWIPMSVGPEVFPRERRQWQVMARIRDGFDLAAVNTELEGLARRTELAYGAEFEEYEGWRLEAATWTEANVRAFKPAAFILFGAVGFVLLLVCSNVASMLLSRSAARRREMAVRTAVGAGRRQIVGQVLTESLVLAGLGGLIGVALARFGTDAVAGILAAQPFVAGTVELNGRVLAFTAGASVLAGLLFGLVPAIQAARPDVQGTLKMEGGGATGGRSRLGLQRALVGVEVALALVLLMGGGLFVSTLLNLNAVDTGFQPDDVLTMRLTLPWEEYSGPEIGAFFQELEERVAGLPGVSGAAAGSQFPPIAFSRRQVATETMDITDEGQLPVAMATLVTPGYFEALGIPLVRGRAFTELDVEGLPMVTVVNRAAADLLFPGVDPLGQRVQLGEIELEVVGIVGNTLNQGLDQPVSPEIFASHRQLPGGSNQLFLIVRTTVEPLSVLPAIRDQVRAMDSDQPVYAIRTVRDVLALGTAPRRIAAGVLAVFAGFALVLAAVGIYAVVSFGVSERTREIGLRMALGAESHRVRRLMVRQALVPVLMGSLAGAAGALALGRVLGGLLFEISPSDPTTLALVTTLLAGVAALASYVPALRASRLDPAKTLRVD